MLILQPHSQHKMIQPGQYNELQIISKNASGLILGDGKEEVLLPQKLAPAPIAIGDMLEVFVFIDNEGKLCATTDTPYACVGDFACMTVIEVNEYGAFLDWGISKDIFVSFREQRVPMKQGYEYIVYIYLDPETQRIAASSKWSKFLSPEINVKVEDEVSLLIAEQTDLGFKAIINNKMLGLLYKNEIFEPLQTGDRKKGYIKQIREDDKIDLSLQVKGYEHIEDSKYKILHLLENNKGILELGDKSSPEEIYQKLKLSKKAFKKTIGGLYKDQLITIEEYKIVLLPASGKKAK
jgi:predicted RNA-binding protein (virulence factor B family)